MAKAQTPPLDKPNRRTVEQLFHDLLRGRDSGRLHAAYEVLSREVDQLEEKLLSDRRFVALKRRRDAAYSKWWAQRERHKEETLAVRRLYQANGLTPKVVKAINALIAKM